MRVGTAYFRSLYDAYKYYSSYEYPSCKKAVDYKIDQGEIHIGKPDVPEGAKLLLDRNEGRYIIEYKD